MNCAYEYLVHEIQHSVNTCHWINRVIGLAERFPKQGYLNKISRHFRLFHHSNSAQVCFTVNHYIKMAVSQQH